MECGDVAYVIVNVTEGDSTPNYPAQLRRGIALATVIGVGPKKVCLDVSGGPGPVGAPAWVGGVHFRPRKEVFTWRRDAEAYLRELKLREESRLPSAVRAKDIEPGQCFRKPTGDYAYLRISESAAKFHNLDGAYVYGVCFNGNMTRMDFDAGVVPMPLSAMVENMQKWGEEHIGTETEVDDGGAGDETK